MKAGYALGDHAVNIQLAAMSLYYLYFLTEVAGLSPSLAGAVLLTGRAVDAFTDPAMGRLSDRTRWRAGRRRPFFLIGCLPFGITLALLWQPLSLESEAARFLAYAALYSANTLCSTLLAVPYMALLPELAVDYQDRTSANTYRALGVVLAVLLTAVTVRPLVEAAGGGAEGWGAAGVALGLWVTWPWLVVYRVSFERPGFRGAAGGGFLAGLGGLLRHRAYRRLCGLFLAARISTDVVAAMLLFFFAHWLRRDAEYPLALGLMLLSVMASLPLWLRISARLDKRSVFMVGCGFWICVQLGLLGLDADSSLAAILGLMVLAGIGYGVADMMPWSMLGDVIDADELSSGERREGLYAGSFTFLRKLGGATGVALAGLVLDLAGFQQGAQQSAAALAAIRGLTAVAPSLFLVVAIVVALGYPIGRARHAEIRSRLAERSP